MASSPEGIGLLGGSFDPVHKGHVSIVHSYLNSEYIDRLFIILSPDPPHKENQALTDFSHRYEMLKLAFSEMENLTISTVEKELSKPSYTVNTVSYFKDKFKDEPLYLCIGEDSYIEFTNWHRWEEIIELCKLLVAKRPDTGEADHLPDKLKKRARYIEHQAVDVSSSTIRKKIKSGEDTTDLLPEEVSTYINKHRLYLNDN